MNWTKHWFSLSTAVWFFWSEIYIRFLPQKIFAASRRFFTIINRFYDQIPYKKAPQAKNFRYQTSNIIILFVKLTEKSPKSNGKSLIQTMQAAITSLRRRGSPDDDDDGTWHTDRAEDIPPTSQQARTFASQCLQGLQQAPIRCNLNPEVIFIIRFFT